MVVRKPRRVSNTKRSPRANTVRRNAAFAEEGDAEKRRRPAKTAASEARVSGKSDRSAKKKSGRRVGAEKAKMAAKSPGKKTTAKTKVISSRGISSRTETGRAAGRTSEKTVRAEKDRVYDAPAKKNEKAGGKAAEEQERHARGAQSSLNRKAVSTVAGRRVRRKDSSRKTTVLGKSGWEDRERFPELPREYGKNDLLLMVVDPGTAYASWEITKDRLQGDEKDLALKVADIAKGGASLKIGLGKRAGSVFFEIRMPGKDVVAEIGLLSAEGIFTPILRSATVSFPMWPAFDESGIIRKLFGSAIRAGY